MTKDGFFKYDNWELVNFHPYSIGKEKKPVYNEGLKARYADLTGLGYDRKQHGSDVLDVIKQKDGNEHGAVRQSVDILKSMMKNHYGNGNDSIGPQLQQQADESYMNDFGIQLHYDILWLLITLKEVKDVVIRLTPETFYDVCVDNSIMYGVATFQNVSLHVDQNLITEMFDIIVGVIDFDKTILAYKSYLESSLKKFQNDFKLAVTQSVNSIFNLMQDVYGKLGDAFADAFGGNETLSQIAALLYELNLYATGATTLPNIGDNILQKALDKKLPKDYQKLSQQQKDFMRDVIRFQGNKIAQKELFSGEKQLDNLYGIPRYYEGANDKNHPNNGFKMYADK